MPIDEVPRNVVVCDCHDMWQMLRKEGRMIDTSKLKGRIIEKYGSQYEFAKKIGRTQAFISKVLNGRTMLNQKDIIDWAEALEITIDNIGAYFFAM